MSNTMTLNEVRRRGSAALLEELGPVGFVRYLQQFSSGRGDYTVEHQQWADKLTLDQAWKIVDEMGTLAPHDSVQE